MATFLLFVRMYDVNLRRTGSINAALLLALMLILS